MSIKKKILPVALAGGVALMAGCGYSDYVGHPGHKTQKEAHLNNIRVTIVEYEDDWNGSYVYSAKYNNRNWQKPNFQFKNTIQTYRNEVVNSAASRPGVFTDADYFNKATGFSGGQYLKYWKAIDTDPDADGFIDNFDQSAPLNADGEWIEPFLIIAIAEPEVEIDSFDWDLQSQVKNATELFNALVQNGGNLNGLELNINAIKFDRNKVDVAPYKISVDINGTNNLGVLFRNQASSDDVMQAILDNTTDLQPVDLELYFDNGMSIKIPEKFKVVFNHKVVSKFINE
ncbi:hypothetical protein [Kangiella sp. TOML190]|uniref:hypothetical protein n=1 Tax=Kangiella sp. TOML190 TaxID=2931351 RepID=UPI002040FE33|nr:hypothetical protein [Kangiella sp. TOML190]